MIKSEPSIPAVEKILQRLLNIRNITTKTIKELSRCTENDPVLKVFKNIETDVCNLTYSLSNNDVTVYKPINAYYYELEYYNDELESCCKYIAVPIDISAYDSLIEFKKELLKQNIVDSDILKAMYNIRNISEELYFRITETA